jgi:hypothetical protein
MFSFSQRPTMCYSHMIQAKPFPCIFSVQYVMAIIRVQIQLFYTVNSSSRTYFHFDKAKDISHSGLLGSITIQNAWAPCRDEPCGPYSQTHRLASGYPVAHQSGGRHCHRILHGRSRTRESGAARC